MKLGMRNELGSKTMLKLSDQEKQEIIRYLEADKPLPEKYRFLLFGDKREVELVWNGKTNEICNIVLPFQTIEQVDEPRAEKPSDSSLQMGLFSTDERGRQLKGWTNKLIWGDNKLILSSLKNGSLREEIEAQGGLKLIYIDPPFDVGADFSMDIEIGDETFIKKPNILEEIAYRDTWGKGADSFIAMIYERLVLMRDLLAEDGSIYVHCDWRVSAYIKNILEEVFDGQYFRNEIIWQGAIGDTSAKNKKFIKSHDTIFLFSKSDKPVWNDSFQVYGEASEKLYRFSDDKGRFRLAPIDNPGGGGYFYDLGYGELVPKNGYRMPKETALEWINSGILFVEKGKVPGKKLYMGEGVRCRDVWVDIPSLQGSESIGYSTQKPEALLERILQASSNDGDLVADFFCGSGTTAAVAEKLSRKWISTDLGKFAIHTTRKRMIGVQRRLKADNKDYRAFEILNLGKYERQHFIGINPSLREEERQKQLQEKETAFLELILKAYRAEKIEHFSAFHGKRAGRLVAVELTDFSVFYSQDSIANAEAALSGNAKAASKIVVEKGRIVKLTKDKKSLIKREILTRHWTDWIDYWSVDFDFESKREIIRVKKEELSPDAQTTLEGMGDAQQNLPVWEEQWTGDYIFENEWQSFRTKKDRSLELKSVAHECPPGRRKIAVKVVDIFGNDTMTIVEVMV